MTLVAHSSLLRVIFGPDVLLCSANADACVSWDTKEQGRDAAPETVALVRMSLIKIEHASGYLIKIIFGSVPVCLHSTLTAETTGWCDHLEMPKCIF